MAGHSQFKNIMFRKGKQDAQRSKLFSKLSREITVSAKLGMPDPVHNPRLRAAIAAAKQQSMSKDVIERAIKKAQGGDAESYDEMRYEGFGPGGDRDHRRGADRQPQPHGRRYPRRLLEIWRRARRDGLGLLHVPAHRLDHVSGQRGRCRRHAGSRDRSRRR